MNWKELYALVNENIKNAVSGLYKPAGDVTFAELPELSQSVLGYTYTVTNAFTTDSRFTDYDTETQTGHSFPADTEVAVIVTGTTENPVYMFNVMGGIMDGYATKGDLDNYVEKEAGKGLTTNDYTDADKALVQDSPITVSATGSDLTLSTSEGNINALTVYGKSEVVGSAIKSAGDSGSIEIETCGKNLFNSAQLDISSTNWRYLTIKLKPNTTYTMSTPNLQNSTSQDTFPELYFMLVTESADASRKVYINHSVTKTTNANDELKIQYRSRDNTDEPITNYSFMLVEGSTAMAYEPYNGTMAVFMTGTPLRGIPDTDVRDVMAWNGSAGTVIKNCAKVRLADLTWAIFENRFYTSNLRNIIAPFVSLTAIPNILSNQYITTSLNNLISINKSITVDRANDVNIRDTDYTTVEDFVASLGGAELVYELATPTTQNLTSTENDSLAALRTFTPQTHAQNNAGATMTVEAYAGTANGRAVNDLENRIKSEIDEVKNEKSHFCYSYKIDMNNSDPATCVKPHFDPRYGCDNFNFTSAHMDYANDRFDYGSWEGFIRRIARPCMLKYDGTVDYYLDPDDYSKKITGEASDVADVNYQGNAMVELEKLYFKRYTHNGIQYCFIADRKLDKSFKCYAHHDKYGKELDYIYRACYDGMYDGTRLRSISGIDYHNLNALTAGYIMSNATRQEEMNFAKANNVSTEQGEGWNILHKSEWDYINDILVLISMSTDTQGTFGRGRDSGYVSTSDTGIISTGTMDTKGLFWGKNDSTAGVKVLGIENHWANLFKSCAGWMLISNQHYTKMTFGTEDGSTGTGFNTDGTGYLATGASISANGYISDWVENDNGFLPTAASGSASTYICDYVWQNTATYFALVGGDSNNGLRCGAFCANLDSGAGSRYWGGGAALSYKGLAA